MEPHADAGRDDSYLRTWLGWSDEDNIVVAGRDLATDLMGRLSLTELAYLLVTRREPTAGERRVLDTVLVALADHGLTPSALAARMTYLGAPDASQAAIAAGLLGAGSVFLGPASDTADFLAAILASAPEPPDEHDTGGLVRAAVDERLQRGVTIPGLGHPVHRRGDPRTPVVYAIAEEEGLLGPHLRLLRVVADVAAAATGRSLPLNAAGACGAALVDAGVPPAGVRGLCLVARTAGLVGHLVEEASHPLARRLWLELAERGRPPEV